MNPKPGGAHIGRTVGRYPFATGSYESISTDLNNQAAKHGLTDSVMVQLRHAKENRKRTPYKQQEKAVALINHWNVMDKQLKHKNEYEKIVDILKNTKLKELTHEQLEGREKHLDKLFKGTTR
jgi:hypothetical protein